MAIQTLRYLGAVLSVLCLVFPSEGRPEASKEENGDENYEMKEENEDAERAEQEREPKQSDEKNNAAKEEASQVADELSNLKREFTENQKQSHEKQIQYNVTRHFMNEKGGNGQPQQNENREGNPKEIKYETVRRFNSKEEHVDKDKQGDERASITQVNVNEKNEESRAQSQTRNENAQANSELIEAHLERDGTENRSGKSDAHLPSKTLNHFEEYQEKEVEPLHTACTKTNLLDAFPLKSDTNFSQNFGIESTAFLTLQDYINGKNAAGWKMPLNYPVFLTVTPQESNTVERRLCVWLSSFSSLIPPEMDRHLGFLEIPQPSSQNIEIFANGKRIKYSRTFKGFANDYIYRKEVKKLLDSIIAKGDGEMVNFKSYEIEIGSGSEHTVSFTKKVTNEKYDA